MVVENAVRRYETCWLPLVGAHAATRARSVLAPPLDVAWVWLLHVLDPTSYAKVTTTDTGFGYGCNLHRSLQTSCGIRYDLPTMRYNSITVCKQSVP